MGTLFENEVQKASLLYAERSPNVCVSVGRGGESVDVQNSINKTSTNMNQTQAMCKFRHNTYTDKVTWKYNVQLPVIIRKDHQYQYLSEQKASTSWSVSYNPLKPCCSLSLSQWNKYHGGCFHLQEHLLRLYTSLLNSSHVVMKQNTYCLLLSS